MSTTLYHKMRTGAYLLIIFSIFIARLNVFSLHKILCHKLIGLINYLLMHHPYRYHRQAQVQSVECPMAYLRHHHPVNQECHQCPLLRQVCIILECLLLMEVCLQDHQCLQCHLPEVVLVLHHLDLHLLQDLACHR